MMRVVWYVAVVVLLVLMWLASVIGGLLGEPPDGESRF